MSKLYNLARMTTATVGAGTITLGAAVGGYLSFAAAGVANGDVVTYAISDGAASEIGTGTYNSVGTTLTRTVRKSTNSNAAISLSGSAQVFITAGAEDILVPANNLSDVASSTTARFNLGMGEYEYVRARGSVAEINSLRARGILFDVLPGGMCDAYQTADGIDALHSTGYGWDSTTKLAEPTRSGAASVGSDQFDNLTSWTSANTGTGTTTVIASGSSDPAIGANALALKTGASGVASLSRTFSSVPRNFGVAIFPQATTIGTNALDALNFTIENIDNLALKARFYQGNWDVFIAGAWTSISTAVSMLTYAELWMEFTWTSSTVQTIKAYAGTELLGTLTGQAPAGTATNGKCTLTLTSGTLANREADVGSLFVGSTQLPDNMNLVGVDTTLSGGATQCWVAALIEYVAGETITPGTDFQIWVAPNGHGTYELVTLVDGGRTKHGIVDTAKWVHLVYGKHSFTGTVGTVFKYLLVTANGKYIAAHGLDFAAW